MSTIGTFPGVFHPVCGAEGYINRLVLGHEFDLFADGHLGRAFNHDPVLGAVVVALQAERRTGMNYDAFNLKA